MEYYWRKIFEKLKIDSHDFDKEPFLFHADDVNDISARFFDEIEEERKMDGHVRSKKRKEARILCKFDSYKNIPKILKDKGLFILPVVNGQYVLVKGNGYVEVPNISSPVVRYASKLTFDPISSGVGDSEMQHLDYAFATGLMHEFLQEDELHLLIRGRKYTTPFDFHVNGFTIESKSVQTEVDAGYENKECLYLFEAKNGKTTDTIIRQLYYPFRYWTDSTGKKVVPIFFEARKGKKTKKIQEPMEYHFWRYEFMDEMEYGSIRLVDSKRYRIVPKDRNE